MTEQAVDINTPSQRHWLYGFNSGVLVVVGMALLIFVCVIADWATRSWGHWDWTTNRMYSLSSSTHKLLSDIEQKKQTYQLLSFFAPKSDETPSEDTTGQKPLTQAEKHQQVMDLLDEYARASSAIKVKDEGEMGRDEIERQIADLYKADFKPYQDTIYKFDKVAKDIGEFFRDESGKVNALAQTPGLSPDAVQLAREIQSKFADFPNQLTPLTKAVRRGTEATLPKWTNLSTQVKNFIDDREKDFTLFTDSKQYQAAFPKEVAAYFDAAQAGYKKMLTEIEDYKAELDKLQPLKSDDVQTLIQDASSSNFVLVVGPGSAKALTEFDIYKATPNRSGSDSLPSQMFAGEEAVSSALLAMVRPEKVKVVFVTAAPQHLLSDTFSDIADILKDANFDVLEWSPPGPPTPGSPPPEANPPAEGKGVVWVVFPPEADQQAMMMGGGGMPNPGPVIDATRKHLAEGGSALFLAEAGGGSPFAPSGAYPYEELVKDFGIDVESQYSVVTVREGRNAAGETVRQAMPVVQLTRYQDHEITSPLQSMSTVFAPLRSQMGLTAVPTIVALTKPLPADVQARVLLQTDSDVDSWGETTMRSDAKFDPATDSKGPCPLAVAAVKDAGQKDKEQRVVVIGHKMFASNYFLEDFQPVLVGNQVIPIPLYPGNSELMRNTMLWLAGYENMIAVSAKASAAVRISDITPGTLAAVRVGICWVGLPLLVLLLGGLILFARRR